MSNRDLNNLDWTSEDADSVSKIRRAIRDNVVSLCRLYKLAFRETATIDINLDYTCVMSADGDTDIVSVGVSFNVREVQHGS